MGPSSLEHTGPTEIPPAIDAGEPWIRKLSGTVAGEPTGEVVEVHGSFLDGVPVSGSEQAASRDFSTIQTSLSAAKASETRGSWREHLGSTFSV